MGGLLNRSSARKDETKTRAKRGKRRRNEQEDTPFEHNGYPMQDGNDIDDSKMDLMKTYELWNNKYEQSPIINISGKINISMELMTNESFFGITKSGKSFYSYKKRRWIGSVVGKSL